MRILFAFAGGRGHAEPLVPIASAARAMGHAVAFTGRPSILPVLAELGFDVFPSENERPPRERTPLRAPDLERERWEFRVGFADRIARNRATRVFEVCVAWRPDVLVCDETDFGAMVAAERLDVPFASMLVTAPGFVDLELIAAPLNALRAEHGLGPELAAGLVLSPFPHSYGAAKTAEVFRAYTPQPTRPAEIDLVYVTLGTAFGLETGDLFPRIVAGLRDLAADVLVTVGPDQDPVELGTLPRNVRVERFVPQARVLPSARAVVCHGGSGTVVGALAHGVPLVILPLGADQPVNAARCAELGVGITLDAVGATPDDVREAVSEVLSAASYRSAAERLRDELAALPGPEHAVDLVERLA